MFKRAIDRWRATRCTRRYDLLSRRSELVALRSDDLEFRSDGTLRVIIRRSKADPFGMGRIAFTSAQSAQLVRDWLTWRGPDIEPLFCGIYQGKPINRSLGTTKVKLIFKEARQRRAHRRKM